ncbi:hypothetical protein Nepgr_028873 [Nepenthes gracilis]|uniref:Uncharacterized protein n=1 Tax=Nepenthes gracilis TaxID=150966 RepID=A0AAD3Y4B9_NEPGR|nr:hypothetical protein Nepgr_028873 [Nepenthes gracilis]
MPSRSLDTIVQVHGRHIHSNPRSISRSIEKFDYPIGREKTKQRGKNFPTKKYNPRHYNLQQMLMLATSKQYSHCSYIVLRR